MAAAERKWDQCGGLPQGSPVNCLQRKEALAAPDTLWGNDLATPNYRVSTKWSLSFHTTLWRDGEGAYISELSLSRV